MNIDPTGEVRPNSQKTAPQRTQRTILKPRGVCHRRERRPYADMGSLASSSRVLST